MRGLTWQGEREYIVSLSRRPESAVIVGSGAECDLVLPDPSLSRTHSRISFLPLDQQQQQQQQVGGGGVFLLEDLASSTGSYLKLDPSRPHVVQPPPDSSSSSGTQVRSPAAP
jgi:pSer/pThr/pTyr-binding forkhead associated (FHA) protein